MTSPRDVYRTTVGEDQVYRVILRVVADYPAVGKGTLYLLRAHDSMLERRDKNMRHRRREETL